ncbi:MAG: TolC family protein [Candidatus Hydrogenedentes bacterium]|nr:TolC family protein [Candidatus Hydrogenedentota bacterium]
MGPLPFRLFVSLLLVTAFGCSTTHYRDRADREVYDIIKQKSPAVPGMSTEFTIEQDKTNPLEGLPTYESEDEYLGEAAGLEKGSQVITLEEALRIAVTHNRSYQNQKEVLYLSALSLTLDRHRFTPIFSAGGSADYNRTTSDISKLSGSAAVAQAIPGWLSQAGNIASTNLGNASTAAGFLEQLGVPPTDASIATLEAIGSLSGTPSQLLNSYADVVEEAFTVTGLNQPDNEIRNERSVSGQSSIGVDLLLKGGAQIAIGLTSNFFRFLTGDPSVSTSSALVGSITQPLLRGRGSAVVAEALTQGERDVLYELRSFTTFRKEFAVQVASNYYEVLQNRDAVRNNWQGYQAFKRAAERERAMAAEGRTTQAGLGRIEQEELNAQNSWVNSVRAYRQSLDQFKILLGLSTDALVVLDDHELEVLAERGIIHPQIDSEDAVAVAKVARLDLYNVRDQADDSERKIKVAANALKPDLDLIVTGQVDSKPGEDQFDTLDFQRARWSAGLDVDLPLDRKSERNSYRTTLISYERALRELSLAEDNVTLDVRNTWRNLDQARWNYENRKMALDLAARRVEEQNLRAEIGDVIPLDQIDAQNAYTDAQNELTDALIRHTIARLEFWRDMGILYIKDNGQWEDISDVPEQPSTQAP